MVCIVWLRHGVTCEILYSFDFHVFMQKGCNRSTTITISDIDSHHPIVGIIPSPQRNTMSISHIVINGLPEAEVKVGRLVTSIWDPFQQIHDPPSFSRLLDSQTHVIVDENITSSHFDSSSTSILLKLSQLIGIGHDVTASLSTIVEAKIARRTIFSNYQDAFYSLFSDPNTEATKRWIQNRLDEGTDVYMVVGITTVTDAKVTMVSAASSKPFLKANIPVSHMAALPIPWSALDISIALGVARNGSGGAVREMKGTRVVGAQYCRLKLRKWWQAKKDAKTTRLGTPAWQSYIIPKRSGAVPVDDSGCFMIEASLGEVVSAADIQKWEDEDKVDDEGCDDENEEDKVDSIVVDGVELVF